jgi:hypothetical protein
MAYTHSLVTIEGQDVADAVAQGDKLEALEIVRG